VLVGLVGRSTCSSVSPEGHVMVQIGICLVPVDVANDMSQTNFNGINERVVAWLTHTIALCAVHNDPLGFNTDLWTWMITKALEQNPRKDEKILPMQSIVWMRLSAQNGRVSLHWLRRL